MQPISQYDSTDSFRRVLLQGDPKSGKTCLACQWPGAYVIDADVNLGGPIRWLKENNKTLPIGYDVLDRDETGKEIPLPQRYLRFTKLLDEAQKNTDVKTIIIDSATSFTDILQAETLRLQNGTKMDRQMWGFFFTYGKELMARLKQIRKHIIMTAHEKTEKLPDGSVALPYRIAWPGQMSQLLGTFFTDIWRCEVKSAFENGKVVYKWIVRTMPNHEYKLGNSLGLPAEFEFNWNLIEAKLK